MEEAEIMTITIRVSARSDGLHHAIDITGMSMFTEAANLYKEALKSAIADTGMTAKKLITQAVKNQRDHK